MTTVIAGKDGETVRPSGIIIPDFRSGIERARLKPEHCLYCEGKPDSSEHAIPEALGGRLPSNILCAEHNQLIGRTCDEPAIKELRSYAHLLGIRRQRGGRRSIMDGTTDDGLPIVFEANGRAKRRRLEKLKRDPSNKVVAAVGSLEALEDLRARGALADSTGGHILAFLEKPPMVTVGTSIGAAVEREALKIALHFLASFVASVDESVAEQILPFVTGGKEPGGVHVRSLSLAGTFFPASWPPKHIVATYPYGDDTLVTVLLFGIHGFSVRLPLVTVMARRYVQNLIDDVAPILEDNDHLRTFDWDDRLEADDMEALQSNIQWRHDYFMDIYTHRILLERCRRAASDGAKLHLTTGLDHAASYHAALQKAGFSDSEVVILMHYAREASRRGMEVWEIPFDVARA